MKTTMLILAMIAFMAIGILGSAQEEKDVIFLIEKMPEYPGGNMALMKDINKKVKFPKEAFDKGIAGKVYVTFEVNTKGKIENIRIPRGVDPLLDREALRVINQLKKTWEPGMQDEKTVDVSFTVLFDFKKNEEIDIRFVLSH